jgi:ABC-type Fe3+-hydroxamate transport system substrate-binding protein
MTSSLLEPPTAPMATASGLRTPVDDLTRKEFIGGLIAAGVLTGCGSGERGTDGAGTREVTNAFDTVTIPRSPQRIVADSVGTYAHLTSLGVTPVGAAVPTDISPAYIGGTQEAVKRGIGRAIGRQDAATAAIAEYEARARAVRRRIAAAGVGTRPIGTVRFDAGAFIGIRVQDPSNAVLAELGLRQPAWPKPGDSGYVELSRENLHLLNAAHTLCVCTDDNVVVSKLDVLRAPLWRNLSAVRGGRVHFVGAWNGSDLLQLHRIVEDVERVLLRPS